LRPEGYTELLGDIVITCTGGALAQVGSMIPTANIVVYLTPSAPITSRILGEGGASEAMLLIDEPGSGLMTPAQGNYGPNAPQSLCTTAQQQSYLNPCQAAVGTDLTGQVQVAVVPGTSTAAQNAFQGKIGDFGPNSVAFYNVPVLPPALPSVARDFRITNLRIPVAVAGVTESVQAFLSVSPGSSVMPLAIEPIVIGVVGPPMSASVSAAPTGGGNPFSACLTANSPTLAARLTFTEGFGTSFKTRVVPMANSQWAGQATNLTAPFNQNIPGGLYAGFGQNNESGFILAAGNTTVANTSYTAGLADYGTRLKAVFTNIPAGVTVYVSTTSMGSVAVPGGTSLTPYAVLVETSQSKEGTDDGTSFTPLNSNVTGSDGLLAYPLTAESGTAAAIWEVVNSNPAGLDSLSFSVYVTYTNAAVTANIPLVALSYAPEPGGGTFATANDTQGLTIPVPRFAVPQWQGGQWATFEACSIQAPIDSLETPYATIWFVHKVGDSTPMTATLPVYVTPSNLPVTVTPVVTTPNGGQWLSASLNGGVLTITVNPAGLGASPTAYTGNIKLSAPGVSDVLAPVSLTIDPPVSALSISKRHVGTFSPGQFGATYSIVVSNSASAQATAFGAVTVTEQPPAGLTLVSMSGLGWDCSTMPFCTRNDWLAPGAFFESITVTVNVAANPPARVANQVTVSGGLSASATGYDIVAFGTPTCTVTGDQAASVSDVQLMINEALGLAPPAYDVNGDNVVNVADIQIVMNAAMGKECVL
jgi:uncharacterized repeat protein (TIGR01451 family)